jgi:23S rRNA pseudouridine1911/1915/1917 synthase
MDASHGDLRLARRLQEILQSSYSRAKREVLIGHATVDGKVVTDPGHRLQPAAVVEHRPGLPRRSAAPQGPGIPIVHLDSEIVVVDKPAGVLVHPTVDGEQDTVLSRVVVELARREHRPGRIHIVHRLDRDTSGVMVLARTHAAAEQLQRQFRAHSVTRRYVALVAGDLDREVEVDRAIGRPRPGSRRAALAPGSGGRAARTTVRPIERFGAATLVEAELGTGRTHQVRVHLSFLHHPVLGDPVYGSEERAPVAVPRTALHAAHLGLVHPTSGARLEFSSPVAADLAAVLTVLRRRAAAVRHDLRPAAPAPPGARQNAEARRRPPLRTRPRPAEEQRSPREGSGTRRPPRTPRRRA